MFRATKLAWLTEHISWPKWVPMLSWITGWINVAGWVGGNLANGPLLSPVHCSFSTDGPRGHQCLALEPARCWCHLRAPSGLQPRQSMPFASWLTHPQGYEPQRWHRFLIYVGLTLLSFLTNAFMNSLLPLVYRGALIWSLGGFALVSITVLARAAPNYSSAYFVFCHFINRTGCACLPSDTLVFADNVCQGPMALPGCSGYATLASSSLVGWADGIPKLLQGGLEIPNASVQGPKIMIVCVAIGTVTGVIFLIVLLFVSGNIEEVIDSTAGPLLQILIHATRSNVGAICLLMLPLVCLLFATLSVMTTSSRMIFAFARWVFECASDGAAIEELTDSRDGGLPASRFLARIHPRLGLPLNALILTSVVTVLFGLIFIGSTSAFNAIISASVVALDLSYAMPIAVNCLRGRTALPERSWVLPGWLGWTADTISLVYISLTTVLFLFPPVLPVTGTNMNYCIVAFALIIAISIAQWIVDGKKNFSGPRINVIREPEQTQHRK
ncbi:amino acid permease [Drechmeria coniospora]|uniref:Amino acid permease n=1 Tax=Drechmeria coniospora TaxID=98403 RepID=A0A151GUM6_DRECN|nr:amino acid permease [Drechmeria coniospora]KYK60780.1 amino acid permease [Drechmeria coniospora]